MALQEIYKKEVVSKLQDEFGYDNLHAVPKLKKITVNVGLSDGVRDSQYLETVEQNIRRVTGQQPVKTKARKSISAFDIREGDVVGMKVTLRGRRMWDFLEKLIKVTFPRVRDFRGVDSESCDGQGNYSVGIEEHTAFPEISSDEIETMHGVQVTIGTSAETDEECKALLKHLGFPFKKEESET